MKGYIEEFKMFVNMLLKMEVHSKNVLSAARVSATTQSSAHSASCGFTSAPASLSDCWLTRTISALGVKVNVGPSTADQWLKWFLKAPSVMRRLLSAIWVKCFALVLALTAPMPLDAVWPGQSLETIAGPHLNTALTYGAVLLGCVPR